MLTDRPFSELNLWQRIFAEHWAAFVRSWQAQHQRPIPSHWEANVQKMLSCGDIRVGYCEYLCPHCQQTRKVGFTCKSRLCLRCFKTAVDGWLATARQVLFEGVVHRQVVLTVPKEIRPLILAEPKLLKAFADAGARTVQQLIQHWRPKKKIKVGLISVLQVHGRAGNSNPHLHMVVSEGGVDQRGQWQPVSYFDTKKLRKLWQYHVLTALKKAVRGTLYAKTWSAKLGRMIQHLPAKNFRMVRYYGIYARTVRNKVHALVADVLAGLQRVAQQVRDWVGRRGLGQREAAGSAKSASGAEAFGEMEVRCPRCGTEMILVRVWSASGGVLYDLWAEEWVVPLGVAGRPVAQAEEPPLLTQLFFAFAKQ